MSSTIYIVNTSQSHNWPNGYTINKRIYVGLNKLDATGIIESLKNPYRNPIHVTLETIINNEVTLTEESWVK